MNAPIDYSGSGTWAPTEFYTTRVIVELIWTGASGSTVANGLSVESDNPVFTATLNQNNSGGSYTFSNSVDANQNSNLLATQYMGNTTPYYVRARPVNAKGLPYYANSAPLMAYVQLGNIQ